ncbi:MAG TPA: PhoD-like phosphatase [Stenomitos sp.]
MPRTPLREGGDLPIALDDRAGLLLSAERLQHLPLLLAGPILRRTDSDAVTVWVALKAPREVTLTVYATDAQGSRIGNLRLEGTSVTVALGQYLHIVAVTAKPITGRELLPLNPGLSTPIHPPIPSSLEPGQIYAYDLNFGNPEQNLAQALTAELFPQVTVSYFDHQLPTFAMPPQDLNDLRLAHGSCRKLHGGGQDTLPILDDLIEHDAHQPNTRLHQLFFTGDQIYGDDVADPLLWVATAVGDTLLGWEEHLPLGQTPTYADEYKKPSELKLGQRTDIAKDYCSFTAMLSNSPEKAKSHLFSLGEYYATYLLLWSPILWPDRLPQGKKVYQDSKQARQWDQEAVHVRDCMSQLWKVRRALANVPTYMIFDDHDVTDDWYLNRAWCNHVLRKPLGRRVVQNAMLAYAVFQAWGNTPEQFEQGKPGGILLQAAANWSASAGTDQPALAAIGKYLGIPELEPTTGELKLKLDEDVFILDRDSADGTQPVEWHYTVRSQKHEVIVLDTRTWRGYPPGEEGAIAPPMLLCPTAFKQQIQYPLELTDQLKQIGQSDIEVTFVVLPTNLVSLQIIDEVQRLELEKGNVYDSDVGDAWNLNEVALSRLLTALFQRRQMVVILSGDIHYAATIRLSYWFNPARQQTPIQHQHSHPPSDIETLPIPSHARVLAQLTASAFKNGELKTYVVHTKVKSLAPELPQNWAGWNEPPQLVEIQITPERVRILDVEVPKTGPVVRQIKGLCGNWTVAWEMALKNPNFAPDWQYYVEWIKRERAILAPWLNKPLSSAPPKHQNASRWLTGVKHWVSLLWRNQWLQEGEEVIGRNNFGVVSFKWPQNPEETKVVIQDTYWQPPWEPSRVVYSRYSVPLCVAQPPPPPRVVLPDGVGVLP